MKTITGSFKNQYGDEPAAGWTLTLRPSQAAVETATGTEVGEEKWNMIQIQLDENGSIPPDTRIVANDEMTPAGTFYHISVSRMNERHGNATFSFEEYLRIVGVSPIDLNSLIPEKELPAPVAVSPAPKPGPSPNQAKFDADSLVRVEPKLGRRTAASISRVGFFAGIIYPPTNLELESPLSSTSPYVGVRNKSGFGAGVGILPFRLPFDAAVSKATIIVKNAGEPVAVGLYDANKHKICAIEIDADKKGPATGTFHTTVSLSAGDYYLAWGVQKGGTGVKLRSIGVHPDVLELMSPLRVARGDGENLFPETLEEYERGDHAPPLIYFA
jgi:hypothetical protein